MKHNRKHSPQPKAAASTMEALKTHVAEAAASVWLVIVAVQYTSSYVLNLDVDFKYVYVAAVCLMAGAGVVNIVRWYVHRRK